MEEEGTNGGDYHPLDKGGQCLIAPSQEPHRSGVKCGVKAHNGMCNLLPCRNATTEVTFHLSPFSLACVNGIKFVPNGRAILTTGADNRLR